MLTTTIKTISLNSKTMNSNTLDKNTDESEKQIFWLKQETLCTYKSQKINIVPSVFRMLSREDFLCYKRFDM